MTDPVVTSTENPPSTAGDRLVPGSDTDPAVSTETAETLTAAKAAALVEKEIG